MKIFLISLLAFFNFNSINCHGDIQGAVDNKFRLGNEMLMESLEPIKDKRAAVLTNQTGILSDGTHIIDALVAKGINVVKIFTPEHGIRGDENYSSVDEKTGIPIVSIYGGKTKPSNEDLSDVDVIIYDIQDVGSRFYTYTSTLYYIIEAAEENGKTLIVCDRPVVINPNYVDGFMLDAAHSSFVGLIPTPVCYGMTCGELADFIYNDVFITDGSKVVVSKMQNYSRSMDYNSLKLTWVKPSPSMFTSSTALCYPATCFLEGTNISEGRGTQKPFEYFGAPWLNSEATVSELNGYGLKGVTFETITFTPDEKISAYPPKFFNKECKGVHINVTDKNSFEPVKCGVAILTALSKHNPDFKLNKDNFIDKLAGTSELRKAINLQMAFEQIVQLWSPGVENFKTKREKYLLYN
jgi:uncharacterized protein YbbC (DUF1343 family)